MGLPASLPNEPLPSPTVEPLGWAELQAEGAALVEDVREARPADSSPEERVMLGRLARFGLRTFKVLGTSFIEVVRTQLQGTLTALVEKEIQTADAPRKLALRHIQQAVHRYGVLMESTWTSLAKVPPASLEELVSAWDPSIESGLTMMREEERVVVRFQLDVLVSISVMDSSSLDELTFWAFQAITGARRVEAFADHAAEARQLGELARIRTRRAWIDWSPSDVASEIAPWPNS